jgi:hypothetical protein
VTAPKPKISWQAHCVITTFTPRIVPSDWTEHVPWTAAGKHHVALLDAGAGQIAPMLRRQLRQVVADGDMALMMIRRRYKPHARTAILGALAKLRDHTGGSGRSLVSSDMEMIIDDLLDMILDQTKRRAGLLVVGRNGKPLATLGATAGSDRVLRHYLTSRANRRVRQHFGLPDAGRDDGRPLEELNVVPVDLSWHTTEMVAHAPVQVPAECVNVDRAERIKMWFATLEEVGGPQAAANMVLAGRATAQTQAALTGPWRMRTSKQIRVRPIAQMVEADGDNFWFEAATFAAVANASPSVFDVGVLQFDGQPKPARMAVA